MNLGTKHDSLDFHFPACTIQKMGLFYQFLGVPALKMNLGRMICKIFGYHFVTLTDRPMNGRV